MKVKQSKMPTEIMFWARKAPGKFLFCGKENIDTICSGKQADLLCLLRYRTAPLSENRPGKACPFPVPYLPLLLEPARAVKTCRNLLL